MDVRANEPGRKEAQAAAPVIGEVISIDAGQIRVRLASGETGTLSSASAGKSLEALAPGVSRTFQIKKRHEDGRIELALLDSAAPRTAAATSFENDVASLQNALQSNHHHSPPIAAPSRHDSTREERLREWIANVDREMTRLRKSRAKRLDEEFYSNN